MNFQPIAEKVNLNGRALGVNTVIAVNERIQHSLAYCADRIFGLITALAGFRIDDRSGFHVAHTECHRLGKHIENGAFHTLVIEETRSAVGSIADFRTRNDNTGNTQFREKTLRINAEIQQTSDRRYTVSGDRQHFHSLRIVHLCKLRA